MLINIDLNVNMRRLPTSKGVSCGPKMTAFQSMMLFSPGAPDTPAGGSSWVWKTMMMMMTSLLGEEITQINVYNWESEKKRASDANVKDHRVIL